MSDAYSTKAAEQVRPRLPHLTILGGGPAGLAVGYFAARSGCPLTILEAGDTIGGNARTLRHGEFLFDTGAHRFHDKDPTVTREIQQLLGAELSVAAAPSQIVWKGRRIDFPLTPANLLRRLGPLTMARAIADYARAPRKLNEAKPSLASIAVSRYGRTIADLFLLHYSEKLWGMSADRLSPLVSGQRLKGLDLTTFLLETLRGRRAKTAHLDGRFFYPRRGIGMIMDRLAAVCGANNVRTAARVTRLLHDGRRIRDVEINHRERVPVEQIASSLPLGLTISLLDPAPPRALLELAARLRFRHVALLVLLIKRPRVTANASLYFPERGIPFTRIYEPKNRSAAMAPADKTSLVIEFPCGIEDEAWRLNAEELARIAIPILTQKRLLDQSDVFDCTLRRMPFAYPILECGIEDTVRQLIDYLNGFVNLSVVGRNGQFSYTHIHDLLEAGRLLIDAQFGRVPVTAA